MCFHVINRDAEAKWRCCDTLPREAAQPFRVHCMRWEAVVVLEGALGKGSSMKVLDRRVVYRQMPCTNKVLLY